MQCGSGVEGKKGKLVIFRLVLVIGDSREMAVCPWRVHRREGRLSALEKEALMRLSQHLLFLVSELVEMSGSPCVESAVAMSREVIKRGWLLTS
jgi:hypothetical protein